MIQRRSYPATQFIILVSLFAVPSISFCQENGAKKRETVGQAMVQWISKARDDVQFELESIQDRYDKWKSEESPLHWELNRGDLAKAENQKLARIDNQIVEMENQIRNLEMERKLIEMKSRLMQERVEELKARKKSQQVAMQKLARFFRMDEHFRSEIARKSDMYEEIVRKLAEIDLQMYSAKEKETVDN